MINSFPLFSPFVRRLTLPIFISEREQLARPAATANILHVVLALGGLWRAAMLTTLHLQWESGLDPLVPERGRVWEILLKSVLLWITISTATGNANGTIGRGIRLFQHCRYPFRPP